MSCIIQLLSTKIKQGLQDVELEHIDFIVAKATAL